MIGSYWILGEGIGSATEAIGLLTVAVTAAAYLGNQLIGRSGGKGCFATSGEGSGGVGGGGRGRSDLQRGDGGEGGEGGEGGDGSEAGDASEAGEAGEGGEVGSGRKSTDEQGSDQKGMAAAAVGNPSALAENSESMTAVGGVQIAVKIAPGPVRAAMHSTELTSAASHAQSS